MTPDYIFTYLEDWTIAKYGRPSWSTLWRTRVHGEYKNKPEYNISELITTEENDELYGWYFVAMDNLFGKRSIVTLILIGIEILTPMLLMARYEKKMLSGLKLY